MFIGNLFKLIFFLIAVYFFYSVFRMLLFAARNTAGREERLRRDSAERMKAGGKKGGKGEDIIELDKNQYKVE
ncbi:MAG TPA: hypothetical protein P5295_01150 [Spirochaetota bacterium]|nr:hypothetical protein [Spirochaetota bacterium]